jgi:hypothetical protein
MDMCTFLSTASMSAAMSRKSSNPLLDLRFVCTAKGINKVNSKTCCECNPGVCVQLCCARIFSPLLDLRLVCTKGPERSGCIQIEYGVVVSVEAPCST